MTDERQTTSHDDGAATEDEGRIERLRELLTAPIKIPESESGASRAADESADPEDYPAPAVDIPPHVRAAAEAAAHAGDDAQQRDENRRSTTGRKRRTWADAFLDTGRRDLSGGGGDAAAQLMTRLDELDRRTSEDVAQVRARADEAVDEARIAQQDVTAARDAAREDHEAATARLDATATSIEDVRRQSTAAAEAAEVAERSLRAEAAARRDEVTRLTAALADAEKSAAAAGEQATAAARRAATATVVGVIAVVLALAALGAAFAL